MSDLFVRTGTSLYFFNFCIQVQDSVSESFLRACKTGSLSGEQVSGELKKTELQNFILFAEEF